MVDIRNTLQCEEAIQYLISLYKDSRDPIAEVIPIACELISFPYSDVPDYLYESRTKKEGPYKSWMIPFLQYRLTVACILADNLQAEADLIVASLIGPGLKARVFYRNSFEPKIGTVAFERVSSILKTVPNTFTDLALAAESVDELLWDRVLEQQYQELLRKARKNKTPQTYYIKQAYALAKVSHKGVFRKSGEPYLSHPLAVAHILADSGVESELIAAALLHDVIEDAAEAPEISRKAIEQISPQIVRYVDAVTSVEREYDAYAKSKKSLGESYRQMDKADLDRATVNKLLSMSREDESMIQAVYIKAADRYHNLLTIDGMPYDNIRSKLDETEEYYLPIFRAFGINDFITKIENQLWRARNPSEYQRVSKAFQQLLKINKSNLQDVQKMLSSVVEYQIEHKCEDLHVPGFFAELIKEEILPYQVYQSVKDENPDDICSAINKQNISLLHFSIIESGYNSNSDLKLFASVFIKTLEDITEDLKFVITKIWAEPVSALRPDHKRIAVELENEMASRVVVYLYDQEDYYMYKNGSAEGVVTPDRDDDLEMLAGSVRIHRADDTVIFLPKGSTALDFAFAIHEDVGMYAVKASINDSDPLERLLFCTLNDDDKVVIQHLADREGGYGEPQIKIEWLNHVVTNSARKRITRWLQDKYERPGGEL